MPCRLDLLVDFVPRKVVGDALSAEDPSRTAIVEALGLLAAGGGGEAAALFVGRNRFDVMVEVRYIYVYIGILLHICVCVPCIFFIAHGVFSKK